MSTKIKVGDVIKLKGKYEDAAKIAIVIYVNKSEFCGNGGWISFDFHILSEKGEYISISETCIEEVIHSNQSPSTWLHLSCSSD